MERHSDEKYNDGMIETLHGLAESLDLTIREGYDSHDIMQGMSYLVSCRNYREIELYLMGAVLIHERIVQQDLVAPI